MAADRATKDSAIAGASRGPEPIERKRPTSRQRNLAASRSSPTSTQKRLNAGARDSPNETALEKSHPVKKCSKKFSRARGSCPSRFPQAHGVNNIGEATATSGLRPAANPSLYRKDHNFGGNSGQPRASEPLGRCLDRNGGALKEIRGLRERRA
jgi:hypothetical protein